MSGTRSSCLLAGVAGVLLGCALPHRTAPARSASRQAVAPNARSSNVLSGEELRLARGPSAYDVIQQLRPLFLRTRGPQHVPTVFVDYMRRETLDDLRLIPSVSIAEIRYLDSAAATQHFGTGYTGGIIHVLTRSR